MEKLEPCACQAPDERDGRLKIEVKLPGVEEKDVKLEMKKEGFCINAPWGNGLEYSGCFPFAHEVKSEKAEVRIENGLLKILVPLAANGEEEFIYRPAA